MHWMGQKLYYSALPLKSILHRVVFSSVIGFGELAFSNKSAETNWLDGCVDMKYNTTG